MLTENDVVEAVARDLTSRGYVVRQTRRTDEHGTDVIAENPSEVWFIEAKGGTSSKRHTNRFGKTFTLNQVNSHVSRAVFTAMAVRAKAPAGDRTRVAIALPDDDNHRGMVGQIAASLGHLGVAVFWVTKSGQVRASQSSIPQEAR